jgi:nitroreductase
LAMDILEAIQTRHCVRDFEARPVPKDVVMNILAAANRSPSGGNGQPWEVFVAAGATLEGIRRAYLDCAQRAPAGPPPRPAMPPAMMERFAAIRAERMKRLGLDPADPASAKFFADMSARLFGAPMVAIICQDKAVTGQLDLGLYIQTICLAAMHFGVDALIATQLVSQPDILRPALDIPENLAIVTGVGLGYAKPNSLINTYRSPRRPIEEVVRYKD